MIIRQLAALVEDTLRQAWSRKVFLGLFLNGSISVAALLWYLRTISARGQYSTLTLLSQADPRFLDNAFAAKSLLGSTVWFAFWTQTFFALMLSLGFLGTLLAPERNLFLAATPVRRWLILVGRFLGCLAVVTPGVLYPMAGIWIAAGLRFGVWHLPFLAGIATTMLAFAALLALMALVQTAVQSTAVVLAVTTGLTLLNLGVAQPRLLNEIVRSEALTSAIGAVGLILPRTSEIAQWTAAFVQSGSTANAAAVLGSTALFATAAIAAAAMVFSRKEY